MATKAVSQIDARVVDQALVASFMNAEPPKVWRADMNKLTTATLELRSEEGRYRLVMISPTGEEDVASFNDRESGTAALQAVMQAMLSPASSTVTATPVAAPKKKGGFFRTLLKVILWMVALFVTLVVIGGLLFSQKGAQMITSMDLERAGVAREGAPTTADDYFGK